MYQSASKAKERRKNLRYRVQLPVLFRWSNSEVHTAGGFTRDVSLHAFFVSAKDIPPLKAHLQCQILMPASVELGGNAITAKGRVTRLSTRGEGSGFVVNAKLYAPINSVKKRLQ